WSSGTTSVATVNPTTGVVYGNTAGTTVITYSTSSCSVTTTVTVSALPPISGGTTVCAGATIQLSNSTPGGNWSSSDVSIATVNTTGTVSGVAVGSANIPYTLGSCSVSAPINVGAAISPITGTTVFCVTGTTALSNATAGGTWSSGNTGVATVSGT